MAQQPRPDDAAVATPTCARCGMLGQHWPELIKPYCDACHDAGMRRFLAAVFDEPLPEVTDE